MDSQYLVKFQKEIGQKFRLYTTQQPDWLGAFRTTPIANILAEAGLPSLENRNTSQKA